MSSKRNEKSMLSSWLVKKPENIEPSTSKVQNEVPSFATNDESISSELFDQNQVLSSAISDTNQQSTTFDQNQALSSASSDIVQPSTSSDRNQSLSPDKTDILTFDIGEYIGKTLTSTQKSEVLKRCWMPSKTYNFKSDTLDPKRCFIYSWLNSYEPWLCYSKKLKGALCLYCVLFPPAQSSVQGFLGAFIIKPFTRYKHMHEACRQHMKSNWHQTSLKSAKSFVENVPVTVQMISGHQNLINENRKILESIISTIIFCGTHDMPLRGKESQTGKCLFEFLL